MELLLRPLPSAELEVEVVEHKGLGHPDTMCDAIAEAFGQALARWYRQRFGTLLHFNVDKALLAGGASRPAWHGGEVLAPMQLFLAGRATREVRGVTVPVDELAVEAGKAWVRSHLHALDPERHVTWTPVVRGGSSELVELFLARGRQTGAAWLANDTSVGAGFAPFSRLEQVVLAAGARLRECAREWPEVGEDVKVMGVRRGGRAHLTVSCALIDRHLGGLDAYAASREAVRLAVRTAASQTFGGEVSVEVNAADDVPAGRVYLTVTGTSAEAGDDGQVGRGNRVNGLITPYRPMSLEAAAGKNPGSHVGKLYNVAAHRLATKVVEQLPEVLEAHCFMLSRIGQRVDDPVLVDLRVRLREGVPIEAVRARADGLVRAELAHLDSLADELLAGRIQLY